MKVIKPENINEFKKEEKIIVSPSSLIDGTRYSERKEELIDDNTELIIDGHKITPFDKNTSTIVFEPELQEGNLLEIKRITPINNGLQIDAKPIKKLMQEIIDENKIKVEITLTKRQKEIFDKKGGERWLKKQLLNRTK